ncbi:vomeronasal type-1 receptor 4 [Rattus norvegicus]|uniref:vomeronasal type-1 receptor 4 n=1 Tax=Rattus norvegicus TaxID=10116 RepID=UPI000049F1E4|nr:vomeronasal type-1 receptor 4 [Rattus norvegicus]|eukprot:NP_001009517.1 vomeronasal 1 receptor 3 [Rattus norvegicus]
MYLKDLIIGIVFLLQSTVGSLGNVSLLSCYLINYYIEHRMKTSSLILSNLFTANFLILLSKGLLHTVQTFGIKGFINDFVCKFLLYIQRLGRNVSISSTCFLSVFQAITISPRNSFWMNLKAKVPHHIGLFTSLCWILYMVLNMIFPVYMYNKENRKNLTQKHHLKYCSTVVHDHFISSLYTTIIVLPEILFSFIIIWSSSSMVVILYMHRQNVQHIHSITVSSRTSPESRATHRILALMFTFIGFYALSSVLQGCIALVYNPGWWLVNITAIISMCFPSLGPFVMNHDSPFPRLCFT